MEAPIISAQARGQRRVWQARTHARFQRLVKIFDSTEVRRSAKQFVRLNGGHKQAAAVLLREFKDVARLEAREVDQRRPCLIWSCVDAPDCTPFRGTDRDLSPDEEQWHAAVHYLMTTKDGILIRGLWGMTISAHSIGRAFMREPTIDLDNAIHEAHLRLLNAPQRSVEKMVAKTFFTPASSGFFWCDASVLKTLDAARHVLHVRCRSFLNRDIIQETIDKSLLTLNPDDVPLCRTLLHPMTLRRPTA